MRPKNGLPDRVFSASAQSSASVRSDAFAWRQDLAGLCGGTRLSRRSARTAQDGARDHEISVRRDFEQVKAADRAVAGTSAVAPGHNAQLHRAERDEVFRAVDDVSPQGRDFLLDGGETPGAGGSGRLLTSAPC
jgi:hypothetical protein